MNQSFTSWWIDNYIGWGQFRSPPTGPMPVQKEQNNEDRGLSEQDVH